MDDRAGSRQPAGARQKTARWGPRALAAMINLLFFPACLPAQSQGYSLGWYRIAGGGGTSTGGTYQITGSIGQPDASGAMTGGAYSLTGGFWSLLAVPQGPFTYTTTNGTINITGYTGSGGAVTIPSTINGLPVTSIGDKAFLNATSLTSITIPGSVTNIGVGAFAGCNLTNVTIANGLTSIADGAFVNCIFLTSITIPGSVTSIRGWIFQYCYSLTSVTIPSGVSNMGAQDSWTATASLALRFPAAWTNIADYGFYDCTSLSTVYFNGDAPSLGGTNVFNSDNNVTAYYAPGTTGWAQFSATAVFLPCCGSRRSRPAMPVSALGPINLDSTSTGPAA